MALECSPEWRLALTFLHRHTCWHSSPGEVHVIWRVTGSGWSRSRRFTKQLAREFGTDHAATSPRQATRPPGFLNHKYRPPHLVDAEYRPGGSEALRRRLSDFDSATDVGADRCASAS